MNQIIPWLRFHWSLDKLPKSAVVSPAPFLVRSALRDEEDSVARAVISAFSMDSTWGDSTRSIASLLQKNVAQAFPKDAIHCVVLVHGTRIIGASALNVTADAHNNLTTGPCILHEYRSRGLGSLLLHASLVALRDAGLSDAHGVTRANTTAAKFVYPKFDGKGVVTDSGLESEILAA